MNVLKTLAASRKFWLSLAGVGTVVATVGFGVGDENAEKIASLVVTVIVALVAAIAGEDIAAKLKGTDTEQK
jgi:hypothetical protein